MRAFMVCPITLIGLVLLLGRCCIVMSGPPEVLCVVIVSSVATPPAPTHLSSAGATFNLLAVEANGGDGVKVLVELEAIECC